jgi:hypothetical protein
MKTKVTKANSATFCASALELEDNCLKGNVRVQHTATLIVGSEVKFEKMKLFPAVS